MGDLSGDLCDDLRTDEDLTPERYVALGLAMMDELQNRVAEEDSLEAAQFFAVFLSGLQFQLYGGIYKPTKGNSVYALEAFCACHRLGLYPPTWVLNWLADAFGGYLDSEGKSDLSALLGVKRGKGQTPIFKEAAAVLEDSDLHQEMGMLVALGATILEAAEMVAGRREEDNMKCPSIDTLSERYGKRGWSKMFKLMKSMYANVSDEDKKRVIAAYPPHTIPLKFK